MFMGGLPNSKFDQLDFWVSPGAILSDQGTKPVFPFWSEPGRGWMQTMISKSTKEPEKLAKWLSFMTSPEGMTLGSFGIEGVQYTKDDKGLITRTEKGVQDQKDSTKTAMDIFWQFANIAFLENVQPAPTKREGAGGLIEMEAKTALGRSPEIVRYDASVTDLPGISTLQEAKMQPQEIKYSYIMKLRLPRWFWRRMRQHSTSFMMNLPPR